MQVFQHFLEFHLPKCICHVRLETQLDVDLEHGRVRISVAGAHILIVDDVLTTGATTVECTQTLLAAGACCTSVLTFARAFDTRRLLG